MSVRLGMGSGREQNPGAAIPTGAKADRRGWRRLIGEMSRPGEDAAPDLIERRLRDFTGFREPTGRAM